MNKRSIIIIFTIFWKNCLRLESFLLRFNNLLKTHVTAATQLQFNIIFLNLGSRWKLRRITNTVLFITILCNINALSNDRKQI